ncbi:MAG: DarT ssDNA thymidine ADP-ribosyltransferase family protein [Rhodoferax sp.]|nr:DarT ssDNA thymidine ADP-ribosyltransferase family protein [Rhodoferax sp.]
MAILAYQAFIVFSLIVIRIVARRHLATACFVWSGFTVLNLFFWPLILVQLAVVWVTYAVLKPKDDTPPVSDGQLAPQTSSPHTPATTTPETHFAAKLAAKQSAGNPPPHKNETLDTSQTILGTVNKAITDLNSVLERARAVQEATSLLDMHISREKSTIELYLGIARSEVERDALFAKNGPIFQETYEKYFALLSGNRTAVPPEEEKEKLSLDYVTPVLSLPTRHVDREIADAIEQHIRELQQQREAFFANLKNILDRDVALRTRFFKVIEGSNLSKIWEEELKVRRQTAELNAHFFLPKPANKEMPSNHTQPQTSEQVQISNPATQSDAGTDRMLKVRPRKILIQPRTSEQAQIVNLATQSDAVLSSRRANIQVQVAERSILHLIHFTRVANLESIMNHGLLSVQTAQQQGVVPLVNDQLRLDGHKDAISLSIGFPNSAMFYKYRQLHPQERWVVLLLKPEILWTHDCAYCLHNAADKRINSRPWSELSSDEAFQSMFAEAPDGAPSRTVQRLDLSDPTDVQAEVLVRGNIAPSMLIEMVFEHPNDLEAHRYHTGPRIVPAHVGSTTLRLLYGPVARVVQMPGSDFFASRRFARNGGVV